MKDDFYPIEFYGYVSINPEIIEWFNAKANKKIPSKPTEEKTKKERLGRLENGCSIRCVCRDELRLRKLFDDLSEGNDALPPRTYKRKPPSSIA
jgi:hypothetical protein